MTDTDDIATALRAALPEKFHADIPVLVQVLTAARDGQPASVATENLQAALQALQGKTLNMVSGNITVSNVSGKAIAIGHGAISIYIPDTAEQKQAWRNRSRMLEKVRTYWIEGFLQQSLHKVALIELGMQYHPDALEHPWEMFVQSPNRPRTPVPPGTSIAEVFDEFGGELLILGSPGTGKTTMLLELTRTLIERAQQDETHAIPVVFNLSSWAVKRPPLADWLAEELNTRYDVPRKVARAWIENDQILPLLDGLDEVAAAQRTACVEAINAYREQHGLEGMTVCSRIADYEVLTKKLRLQGAVLLQKLTEQQIEEALKQLGPQAELVQAVLQQLRDNARHYEDATAEELTRTPLLLSITTLAYQGDGNADLPPPNAPPAEQQHHVFATYVDRMFRRRGKSEKYTPEQTKHWLGWLAGRMIAREQAIFMLEDLDSTWLTGTSQRWLYYIIFSMHLGILVVLVLNPFVGLYALFGLVSGPILGLMIERANRVSQPAEVISWSWARFAARISSEWPSQTLSTAFMSGLGGLFFGIQGVFLGILWGVFRLTIGAVSSGLSGGTLPIKSEPNEGIHRSKKHGCITGLTTGIIIGLLWGVLEGVFFGLFWGIVGGVIAFIWSAIIAGLLTGGGIAIRHYSIRTTLRQIGVMPRRYEHFLDYASERILLRKVGGGYIFVHRLLMGYFASLYSNSTQTSLDKEGITMPFTHGHALIIGVGNYQHSPRHSVPVTATDAQAIATIVQDARLCGYPTNQVVLLNDGNATRTGMLSALDKLAGTNSKDTVLLFYSGHGDYDTNGNYTLTTHDTRWQSGRVVPGTAISQTELLDKLRAIPAERVLLLFNACHAGELSPTLGDEPPPTGSALPQQTANALLSTGSGRIIITACRENQVAFIGSGKHTLFVKALVEGLRGSGEVYNRSGYISAFDLYTHLYYALDEAVQREVSQRLRDQYGTKQEPELTILKGVGPFAVALYRGAMTLGDFPTDHRPAEDAAVREVPESRSQRALQHISGTGAVGVVGDANAPITTGDNNTVITSGRDTIQAGRDVTQVGGDYVGGDKISGDINVRGVSGSGINIGHKGQAQSQQGGDADAFARAFAQVYQAINTRPDDTDVERDEITETVRSIEEEARKGDQANEKKLTRWLRTLAGMAGDIFDVTVAALTGPQAAVATVARKVAAKAKQEREQG